MLKRAYSILTVKAVDDEQRIIRGTATTPTPDRIGDIVEPLGVKFKNPMPLLWQHQSDKPVGRVSFDRPTEKGIEFEARLPKISEPGTLKDRVDEAWQSVKEGLVAAVSIGFRAIEHSVMDDGGWRFIESEVLELSLVTIPANADATISLVKSIDTDLLAASGREQKDDQTTPPGVTGKSKKSVNLRRKEAPRMKTVTEQIAALESTRAANAARMEEVMQKSMEDGRSTDAAEQEEFDTLEQENIAIDGDLKRFRALEKSKAATAKPVETVRTVEDGTANRASVQIKRTETLAPGIRFARVVKCIGMGQGSRREALEIAKEKYPHDETIINIMKAAVAAGTTSDATWAGPLVGDESQVFADFIEFLRPMTIIGKFGSGGIPSLRRVPFRTALIGQTSGGAGYWVGEGKGKPLTALDFSRTTLAPLKVANIAVVTDELLRDSSPSAEMIIRDQLAAALQGRLDTDFIDPTKAASAGVSPAAITNTITPTASAGSTADNVRTDLKALFTAFIAANNAPTSGVFVMASTTALSLSLMVNSLGQSEFPGITMNGGTLAGLPVITSEYITSVSAGSYLYLVNAQDIYVADDGGIEVDMSREASLEMADSTTIDSDTPSAVATVSLWQTNSVGFRAERTINWARRRDSAVAAISEVAYG